MATKKKAKAKKRVVKAKTSSPQRSADVAMELIEAARAVVAHYNKAPPAYSWHSTWDEVSRLEEALKEFDV